MNQNERNEILLAMYDGKLPKHENKWNGFQVRETNFGTRLYEDGWLVGSTSWVLMHAEQVIEHAGYKILQASIKNPPNGFSDADFFLSYNPDWDVQEKVSRFSDRNATMSLETEKALIETGQFGS